MALILILFAIAVGVSAVYPLLVVILIIGGVMALVSLTRWGGNP